MTERPCPHRDDHACSVCEDLAAARAEIARLRDELSVLEAEIRRLNEPARIFRVDL
jgi:cell division protein FtsB